MIVRQRGSAMLPRAFFKSGCRACMQPGAGSAAAARIRPAVTDAPGRANARVVASPARASALIVRPRSARARRWVERPRVLLTLLLVGVVAAVGGGFTLGQAGGADTSAARQAGAEAGQAAGARAGEERGFRTGYVRGRKSTYREAYRSAYRSAVRRPSR